MPPPDFRLDIVREDDGRAGQRPRQVDGRKQEVADEQVEVLGSQQVVQRLPELARTVFRNLPVRAALQIQQDPGCSGGSDGF
jgi:hypothetical protein